MSKFSRHYLNFYSGLSHNRASRDLHVRNNQNTRERPSSKTTSSSSSPVAALRRQRSVGARLSVGLEPLPEEEGAAAFKGRVKGRVPNMTDITEVLKVDEECKSSDSGFIEGQFNMEDQKAATGLSVKEPSEAIIKQCRPLFGLVKHHVSSRSEY